MLLHIVVLLFSTTAVIFRTDNSLWRTIVTATNQILRMVGVTYLIPNKTFNSNVDIRVLFTAYRNP
jgi:hypothetical protein